MNIYKVWELLLRSIATMLIATSILFVASCGKSESTFGVENSRRHRCTSPVEQNSKLDGGLVDYEYTAEAISEAIAREHYGNDWKKYRNVDVIDKIDRWGVTLENKRKAYGGTLVFDIEKCSGHVVELKMVE
jgi:hypothetical protein